jgi:hypothetical protein
LVSIKEIIATKLEVVAQGGRKKDFWDLHYFLERCSFEQFFKIYEKRYLYSCDSKTKQHKLIDFELLMVILILYVISTKLGSKSSLTFFKSLVSYNSTPLEIRFWFLKKTQSKYIALVEK